MRHVVTKVRGGKNLSEVAWRRSWTTPLLPSTLSRRN